MPRQPEPEGQLRTQGQLLDHYSFSERLFKSPFQLSLRIVVVTISPTISNSFSFDCPVDPDQIEVRASL